MTKLIREKTFRIIIVISCIIFIPMTEFHSLFFFIYLIPRFHRNNNRFVLITQLPSLVTLTLLFTSQWLLCDHYSIKLTSHYLYLTTLFHLHILLQYLSYFFILSFSISSSLIFWPGILFNLLKSSSDLIDVILQEMFWSTELPMMILLYVFSLL